MSQFPTFEAYCEAKKIDAKVIIPDFAHYPERHRQAMIDHAKLVLLIDEINGGKTFDWKNGKWDKYNLWCIMGSPSGVGFALFVVDDRTSGSGCGSRLTFISEKAAQYAWDNWFDLIKSYFVMQ